MAFRELDVSKAWPHDLSLGWGAYYAIVLWADVMQAISTAAILCAGIAALRRWLAWLRKAKLDVEGPVAVVVPCYLPNEAPIIRGTIEHLMDRLEHVDSLTLYLVYNTPHDMPIEADLREMAERGFGRAGRQLVVQKAEGSRSKAENLNHVLPQVTAKYTAIYDADHYPDPESLALAIRHLQSSAADCVQGSTYIREGCLPFRLFVRAEFFVNYFVVLPAMQAVAGTGFFGGANGIWRTSSLQRLQFDTQALTEDIDCFARAIVQHGYRFEFLPESCSGELLPAGLRAFWRQRLRWSMGWDQVTLRHAASFCSADLPLRKRAGLWYMFFCRWLTQFCAVVIVIFNARTALQWQLAATNEDVQALRVPGCVYRLQLASFYGYCFFISYAAFRGLAHGALSVLPGLLLYFSIMPLYVLFNSLLLAVSLVRVTSGSTGAWVVTSRAHGSDRESLPSAAGKEESPLEKPLLGETSHHGRAGAVWAMALGFLAQGALAGAVVGDLVGQRKVVHPLWGWVPFGLGATTTYVTDGRVVAACTAAGAAIGLLALFVALRLLRRGSQGAR